MMGAGFCYRAVSLCGAVPHYRSALLFEGRPDMAMLCGYKAN